MATRSTICLVLRKEDIGKELKFDESKLPKGKMYSNEYIHKLESVKLEQPILEIYHHFDGYPDVVGETLVNEFNDYDSVLNLMLGGDASSINGEMVEQYCAARGEEWEHNKPQQTNVCMLKEEYVYKFDEDGKWYFKGWGANVWTDLEKFLEEDKNTQ